MGRMKKAEREHFLAIAKEQLAKYDLTIDDLTKEELSELVEEIRDEEKGRVVILDGIEPLLVEKSYKKLAKLHNDESANQKE
jgi:hypothetical protein